MEMSHNFSIGLCIIPEAAFYIWSYFFILFCFNRLAESQSEKYFWNFFVSDMLSVNHAFLYSVITEQIE